MYAAVKSGLPQFGLALLLVLAPGRAAPSQTRPVLKAEPKSQIVARTSPPILQLRLAGKMAGFLPSKAYLSAGGHALTVEFVGTPGVLPAAQADQGMPASAARRVFYEDLWPGVSVSFTLSQKGACEATYTLAPGADVARIRLRYNVPVRMQSDGTLRFSFSTGQASESSPEAWQMVGDNRKAVAVSFAISNGEVGFKVGNYDHSIPLTIDPVYRNTERMICRFAPLRGEMHLDDPTIPHKKQLGAFGAHR